MRWWFAKKKNINEEVADLIKSEDPDFSTLFRNIAKRDDSLSLYKELSRSLHPDRFIGEDEAIADKAEKLYKEVQNYRTDFHQLLRIKEQVIDLLKRR